MLNAMQNDSEETEVPGIVATGLVKEYPGVFAVQGIDLLVPKGAIIGLLGPNGAGKTTMLDSIYYLAFCKSFFNPIDSQNIRHDHEFFVIDGKFVLEGEEERIFCGLKRNEKKRFKRNQKEYSRLADHIGVIPLVMIAPSDGELIREGSDVRRKFMDGIILLGGVFTNSQ